MSPTSEPGKIKISRAMRDILGPLRETLTHYQEALPNYMDAMKQKFPHRPPIDLDCNERRIRDSLLILAEKLREARDAEAIRKRDREEELRVKAEIIARKEEIPNNFRSLLREVEMTKERLRNTQKLIQTNRKLMAEKRKELDEMEAWFQSGEPASREMLRSVGLLKRSASKGAQPLSGKLPEIPLFQPSLSVRSACSSRLDGRARSTVSSLSSRSSHRSLTLEDLRSNPSGGSVQSRRGGVSARPSEKTVTFKTKRPPKMKRAEYCPVGNTLSFRKAGRRSRAKSCSDSECTPRSSESSIEKPNAGGASPVRERPHLDGAARVRATSAEPVRPRAQAASQERPKTAGEIRARWNTGVVQPRTTNCEQQNAGDKPRPRAVSPKKPNAVGNVRFRQRSPAAPKIKKKPPWKPMA